MKEILEQLMLPSTCLNPDRNALDDEFEKHPGHIAVCSQALADAKLKVLEVKAQLGRISSQVQGEVEGGSTSRLTVTALATKVAADPEVRKVQRILMNCEHRVNQIQGVLAGLEAKTSALKHLSELWQSGYYTTGSSRERAGPQRRRNVE